MYKRQVGWWGIGLPSLNQQIFQSCVLPCDKSNRSGGKRSTKTKLEDDFLVLDGTSLEAGLDPSLVHTREYPTRRDQEQPREPRATKAFTTVKSAGESGKKHLGTTDLQ